MADLAPELLGWLEATLGVDPAWRVREDRALTRWPYRLRQRIEVAPPREDRGAMVTRITATTPLVRGVVDADRAVALVAASNALASLGAMVFDPEAATVSLRCAASVRPRNRAWLLPVVAGAFALQVAVPEAGDPAALAEGFGGRPDLDPHPDAGPRPAPDDSLTTVGTFQRDGLEPVRLTARDYRGAAGDLGQLGIPAVEAGTSLQVGIEMPAMGGAAHLLVESSTHPGFGSGLLTALEMAAPRGSAASGDGARIANDLNRLDIGQRIDGQGFGAWTPGEDGPGHVTFLPNLLVPRAAEADRRARLVNAVLDGVLRARWLDATWERVEGPASR
jgi:hypothetical protein